MLRNLRLMIANFLLPQGFSIALPGTTILPPLDEPSGIVFSVHVEEPYLRIGHMWYCPTHNFKWAEDHLVPCTRCETDAFEQAKAKREEYLGRTPDWPKSGPAQKRKLLERITVRRKD
jgi:hypothetical protein